MNVLKNIKVIARSVTVTLFCMLFVIPVYSGQVTYPDDSYSSGDPLTALDLNAKFNEIKSTVNGNAAGVAFASSTLDVELSTSTSIIQSVPLSAPGPGLVIVSFSAFYIMIHTNGAQDQIEVGIAESSSATVSALASRRFLYLDSGFASGEFDGSVASHAVFEVPSAGNYIYYVLGVSNKASGSFVSHSATQAVFVPNSY